MTFLITVTFIGHATTDLQFVVVLMQNQHDIVPLCIISSWYYTLFVGGDIFIHAKSSNYSKLYELAQAVMRSFPEGNIEKAEDIYGWTYQEGRDLSGFIDGKGGLPDPPRLPKLLNTSSLSILILPASFSLNFPLTCSSCYNNLLFDQGSSLPFFQLYN